MLKLLFVATAALFSSATWAAPNCASLFSGVQSKQHLVELAQSKNPPQHVFIKDAPVFGYRITSGRFEDIPLTIRQHLGAVDQTKYTPEYLEQNIGSVFALQMNGDKADFYVIGKATFDAKYAAVSAEQVAQKNGKYLGKLAQQVPELFAIADANLVAVLKMTPVPMVRMSDMGYALESKVTIESPWGEQTKPAGQDAFLVFDESKQQFYMVNVGADGLPLSYVPARQ